MHYTGIIGSGKYVENCKPLIYRPNRHCERVNRDIKKVSAATLTYGTRMVAGHCEDQKHSGLAWLRPQVPWTSMHGQPFLIPGSHGMSNDKENDKTKR